jgi:hypothetical protein
MNNFALFCRNATDSQLLAILEKEEKGRHIDSDRESDYRDAREEAIRRGISLDLMPEMR